MRGLRLPDFLSEYRRTSARVSPNLERKLEFTLEGKYFMFDDMQSDALILHKKVAGTLHHFRGNVQSTRSKIYTDDARLSIEEGDLIERPLASSVEWYTVVDRGYFAPQNEIPAHYQMKVQKNIAQPDLSPQPNSSLRNDSDESRHAIAALRLLHPAFQDYGHYFRENKLAEAIAAAFERYENRLNEIRDASKNSQIMATSGHALVYKLFEARILKEPYPTLGSSPGTKLAYEKGLLGIMSGGVSWFRNSRTHEKHNLPDPTPQEAIELLFVASFLMQMLDLSYR